ncbi:MULTISPECIES: hypothetical protein [unclassified Bradyrhizobium]|uniref:hypothetical protein n=1 Tax=unclassified Bradyrhizobium TaxID=2631580 RepID=UPI0028E93A84|nr:MULTISPECIES: hypothetical protein [unclassified Bradyrhizobium]
MMFAAVLTAWLGLWGPIDIVKLKDWQTLTASIVAPTIALCAAYLAYQGAMAKVYFDQREAERRRDAERLGLYLRMLVSLGHVAEEAGAKSALLGEYHMEEFELRLYPALLAIDRPQELDEAWLNIHLIPPQAIEPLQRLRNRLFPAVDIKAAYPNKAWTVLQFRPPAADHPELAAHRINCAGIEVECNQLIRALEERIPPLQDRLI